MKIISGLIILFLTFISSPAAAEEIHISTVEDLYELSQEASIDEWSRDKLVILQNDIDLKGQPFSPIPIFGGSFDGGGHTISGLLISEEGSNFGLFRYLETDGIIENLNVKGTVIAKGQGNFIGGIVGYNQGRIENSTFSGLVEGNGSVGGIVGYNDESGSLIGSSVVGNIDGKNLVGGLVGHNQGSIIDSRNRAAINSKESLNLGRDIGGITGFNEGLIDDCENSGSVSYTSFGRNIGGIAGRQNAHIANSRNYGDIFGENEVGGIVGKMEPHTNLIIPPSKLEELQEEMDLLDSSITELVRNTRTNSNSLDPNLSRVQVDINRSKSQILALTRASEEDFGEMAETLEGLMPVMDNMSNVISQLIDDISSQGNDLAEDMEDVNNQFSNVNELMVEIFEELSTGELEMVDIAIDVSREEVNTSNLGTITNCENFGPVQGDRNVGGITGSITYDFILDLENEFGLEEELTINTILELRAIILDSENSGNIVSRYNNVGGIVGNMELGYLSGVISSGDIQSLYGDYVGGIAGNSLGIIESSYSKNHLMGNDYIGGIAGKAKEIISSYSLVEISEYNAFIGAIAGGVYEERIIEENYFVSEILHGIDMVSYIGVAEPMEYEDLIAAYNVPEIFENFQLSFIRDGKLIRLVNFQYGDSISEADFPTIPEREGYYGRWEDFDNSSLTFDREVHLEYLPYITILESQEEREGLPIVAVRGNFTEDDYLTLVSNENLQADELPSMEEWRVSIPGNEASNTIRYLPPDDNRNLDIYVLEEEYWVKTSSQWDGKYLVFETDQNSMSFRLVQGAPVMLYLILSLIVVLGIALIINKIYSSRKRKKSVAK